MNGYFPDLVTETDDERVYAIMKSKIDEINKTLPSYKKMLRVEVRREPFERNTAKKIMRYKIKS